MGLQKQAAHRLSLMDRNNLSYLQTFCSTSPRSCVLCWAARHPFILTENVLLSLFTSLENNLPSDRGCGRQWPSVLVYMWITKGLCWNTLWVSRLWVARDALHVCQVISFRSLDAALLRLHFRKEDGKDYVVMVAWLTNGLSLFKHDTKAACSSIKFCFS